MAYGAAPVDHRSSAVKRASLTIALLLLTATAAATVTFNANDETDLTGANSTIIWAHDTTLNASGFTLNGDTLQINMTAKSDQNITITSNTTAWTNHTLYTYNLSGPTHDTQLIKVEGNATSGTNVTYTFTGLPSITYGNYKLSGGVSRTYGYGKAGTLTWHHADWSAQNFTVTYQNDTESPSVSLSLSDDSVREGLTTTISCGASDPAGIRSSSLTVTAPGGDTYTPGCNSDFDETGRTGDYDVSFSATDKAGNSNSFSTTFSVYSGGSGGPTGPPSSGHSWVGVEKTLFIHDTIAENVGVTNVSVVTKQPASDLSISVTRHAERPDAVPDVANAYGYYEITTDTSDDQINETSVEITVNRSFATQHDRVVISRYDGSWTDLPTEPVDQTGDEWTYRATATGFSYYTVRGVAAEEPDQDPTDEPSGDNVTGQNATGPTGPQNATEPQEPEEPGKIPVVPILVILILVAVIGAAYWYHRQQQDNGYSFAESMGTDA